MGRWLREYRRAPSPNGVLPTDQMLAYQMQYRLDKCSVPKFQEPGKAAQEGAAPTFKGDTVYAKSFALGLRWFPGEVNSTAGTAMMTVHTPAGVVVHHNQVRRCIELQPSQSQDTHCGEVTTPKTPSAGTDVAPLVRWLA